MILKSADEDTKRALPVAKYYIMHYVLHPREAFQGIIPKQTGDRLYGNEPEISSHCVRVLFFHILLRAQYYGKSLQAGQLVLGLLDFITCVFDFSL